VAYSLDPSTNCLYRYKLPEQLISDLETVKGLVTGELLSRRVEKVTFTHVTDGITIHVRTFEEHESELAMLARSYADYYTMVEFRN
jgi:hypothetical protein